MSTLLADTIRKTGGTAGVDIRVKNTSVYESDGGTSVTQNLVQGLAKVWNNYTQISTTAITDSFNVSGITDTASGVARTSYANPMANAAYVVSGSHNLPGGNSASVVTGYDNSGDFATGQVSVSTFNASSGRVDVSLSQIAVMGDLA